LINLDFRSILNRAPEPAAVDAWLQQYAQGMNDFGLASRLLGSDEFFADQGQNSAFFVVATYRDVLNRDPTSAELNAWLSLLAMACRGAGRGASAETRRPLPLVLLFRDIAPPGRRALLGLVATFE